jgi:hypothetical protein
MVRPPRHAVVGRAFESLLYALAPPYTSLVPMPPADEGNAPPLGTVIVGAGGEPLDALMALTQIVHTCPWVIPCLRVAVMGARLEHLLDLVHELRHRLVVVTRTERFRRADDAETIVRGVRRRPLPAPTALAVWVAQRVHVPELSQPLADQFDRALSRPRIAAGPSPATYSRLFRQYGPYTARDWRAIARLCRHALWREDERVGARLPLRTAMRYAHHYLRVPHPLMRKRLGWEWVLEAALRVGGYV